MSKYEIFGIAGKNKLLRNCTILRKSGKTKQENFSYLCIKLYLFSVHAFNLCV